MCISFLLPVAVSRGAETWPLKPGPPNCEKAVTTESVNLECMQTQEVDSNSSAFLEAGPLHMFVLLTWLALLYQNCNFF